MKTAQITGSKATERGWPKKRSCMRTLGRFVHMHQPHGLLCRARRLPVRKYRSFAARLSVAGDNRHMALSPKGLVRKCARTYEFRSCVDLGTGRTPNMCWRSGSLVSVAAGPSRRAISLGPAIAFKVLEDGWSYSLPQMVAIDIGPLQGSAAKRGLHRPGLSASIMLPRPALIWFCGLSGKPFGTPKTRGMGRAVSAENAPPES